MIPEKKVIEIIEDHARLCDVINQIYCAIQDIRVPYPNHIPLFNDTLLTDQISTIIEHLAGKRC